MRQQQKALASWLGVEVSQISGLDDPLVAALLAKMAEEHDLSVELGGSVRTQISQLRREARTDPLTGALNRRGIRENALAAVSGSWLGDPPALVLVDVDRLKRINDVHGHAVGDRVLVSVAKALRETVRQDDLVGRWGGDEFLVLCRRVSPGAIAMVCDRLKVAVAAATLEGVPARIEQSISTGAAVAEPGSGLDELLSQADVELYAQKRASRVSGQD